MHGVVSMPVIASSLCAKHSSNSLSFPITLGRQLVLKVAHRATWVQVRKEPATFLLIAWLPLYPAASRKPKLLPVAGLNLTHILPPPAWSGITTAKPWI